MLCCSTCTVHTFQFMSITAADVKTGPMQQLWLRPTCNASGKDAQARNNLGHLISTCGHEPAHSCTDDATINPSLCTKACEDKPVCTTLSCNFAIQQSDFTQVARKAAEQPATPATCETQMHLHCMPPSAENAITYQTCSRIRGHLKGLSCSNQAMCSSMDKVLQRNCKKKKAS
jgi:hypothetical protein